MPTEGWLKMKPKKIESLDEYSGPAVKGTSQRQRTKKDDSVNGCVKERTTGVPPLRYTYLWTYRFRQQLMQCLET